MLTAPLLAPSGTKMFTFTAVLDVRELMSKLYGGQVPDRTLNIHAFISLENYGRLEVQLKATHVIPGDREHDWLFDAVIDEIDPDTRTMPPVVHDFKVGQRVRGMISLSIGGHDLGALYVVQAAHMS